MGCELRTSAAEFEYGRNLVPKRHLRIEHAEHEIAQSSTDAM